ncbi:c-type cytochrome [Nitratireductor mangrovi]|uniref:C-type cytochrome n=1 Tax=Nitratireductor mangrovi TaxID=2599600 RepID=A0A5B8L495_9HYPH|nr:c-type cytochrome [Nitratireductor mangrovi]QDZ02649.1 c-type cytochrome [Nitratireductor mangrovi]
MSRFPSLAALVTLLLAPSLAAAQDVDAGEKLFAKCKACHTVGDGAKHRVGPHLNELFGRTAGTAEGYRYSPAMTKAGEEGLVWQDETFAQYMTSPRAFVKGTKMAFPGMKKPEEIADLAAYLKTFSANEEAGVDTPSAPAAPPKDEGTKKAEAPAKPAPAAARIASHGTFHLGRPATEAEIAAWDIDVRPDGTGLPAGSGTVMQGEAIYTEQCAACHGDFGEAIGRWPVLAGGYDTLTRERPVKTVGSYWPYLSTVYDYVRRAMPFGNARSLSDDDVYALTAYVLYLNDVVTDEEFELSRENFGTIRLPNEDGFVGDDREAEPAYAKAAEPCMSDCRPGKAEIVQHAAVLDVTPDAEGDDEGGGAID